MAQKVSVEAIKTEKAALIQWQILDEQYHLVFSANEYYRNDSVNFGLEANKRYILQISVLEIYDRDITLFSLQINGEPIMLINSDIPTGDHFFPFFTGVQDRQAKITGGSDALISDFPWQVYYISGNTRCGGTIINENWILTAAHCATISTGNVVPISQMSIKAGANNPTSSLDGKRYYVSNVIVHEGYNSQTLENDIALLKLTEPINFTNAVPIKLISSDDSISGATDPGVLSWLTGWGLTNVNPNTYPTRLQKVQLPIISTVQAGTVWPNIPKSDIMAGYLNGNKDACMGDSGGPLVVPVLGEYKLAGIVSWGSTKCDTYGAYTRVSSFEKWIETNTGIQIGYKPPSPEGDTLICEGVESSKYSIAKLAIASSYDWKVLPGDAGIISGNSENATVIWNPGYDGLVTIMLRVTIDNKVSDWSSLNVKIVKKTKLLSQSGDTEICAGQSINLFVDVEGYNLKYKWLQDNNLVLSGISDQMNISSTYTYNSGNYITEISGSCGTVFSNIMRLTVHPLTQITFNSPDTAVPFGENVTLEVVAEGHDLNYQWQKDDELLDNSNASQYLLQNVNANNIGLYLTTVTGTCGADTSNKVYVYVKKEAYSNDPEVFIWPTITSNEFNVALNNDAYYNVHIFNTMGQLLRKQINCQYQTIFNINTLPKGIYIINVFNKSFRKSIKIIKD
jgi:trypsin